MNIAPATVAIALVSMLHAHLPAQAAPEIFSPGIISGAANDLSPAFSPDGKTVVFTRANSEQSTIMISHLAGGVWSEPEIASFSGEWRDLEPAMAVDGSYLIFASNRPASGDGTPLDGHYNNDVQTGKGGNLWRVDRTATGWSEPHRLSDVVNANTSIFSPSVVADGSLYFMQPSGAKGRFHIFRAQHSHGAYATPAPVPVSTADSVGDFDPAVAPDESFMVFSSARMPANGTSLFITLRKDHGWKAPTYMGTEASPPNTGNIEARLGSDRHTLYFSSTRVVPTAPHDRAASERGLELMTKWNNGLANIWRVSLDQWLNEAQSSDQIFAPGVVSTGKEFGATFSPDGRTVFFTRSDTATHRAHIMASRFSGGRWQTAVQVGFSSPDFSDLDPSVSPDGKRLYFVSTRPHPGAIAGTKDMDIWYSDTNGSQWGAPAWIAELSSEAKEGSPTVDRAGTICFFSDRGAAEDNNAIYCSQRAGSGYAAPVRLNANVNAGPSDTSPFLSPDGRTLLFYSTRAGGAGQADLYASFEEDGDWGRAVNLGPSVNTAGYEYNPVVSRDGSMLIFGRDRQLRYIALSKLGIPGLTPARFR